LLNQLVVGSLSCRLDRTVQSSDLLVQLGDVRLQAFLDHCGAGKGQATALIIAQLYYLLSPPHQLLQFISCERNSLAGARLDHLGQVRQDAGIDRVGLNQLSHGLGECACASGIDAHDRVAGLRQATHHGTLVTASGLQKHPFNLDFSQIQQ